LIVDLAFEAQALVLARREQVVDHIKALLTLRVVDAADVDELLKLATGIVAQGAQHRGHGCGWHDDRELAELKALAEAAGP
jgi:hypothetical protein